MKKIVDTAWFDSSTKPVRIGMYKVKHSNVCEGEEPWARWSGQCWMSQCRFYEDAVMEERLALHQDKEWCGGIKK